MAALQRASFASYRFPFPTHLSNLSWLHETSKYDLNGVENNLSIEGSHSSLLCSSVLHFLDRLEYVWKGK